MVETVTLTPGTVFVALGSRRGRHILLVRFEHSFEKSADVGAGAMEEAGVFSLLRRLAVVLVGADGCGREIHDQDKKAVEKRTHRMGGGGPIKGVESANSRLFQALPWT